MAKVDAVLQAANLKIDRLEAAAKGNEEDVAFLKQEIEKLKNAPGADLTPEQETAANAMLDRLETMTARYEALNAATDSGGS